MKLDSFIQQLEAFEKKNKSLRWHEFTAALEKQLAIMAVEHHDGNRSEAARMLGIERTTFLMMIRRHKLKSKLPRPKLGLRKPPSQECAECGDSFRPGRKSDAHSYSAMGFCSKTCFNRHNDFKEWEIT